MDMACLKMWILRPPLIRYFFFNLHCLKNMRKPKKPGIEKKQTKSDSTFFSLLFCVKQIFKFYKITLSSTLRLVQLIILEKKKDKMIADNQNVSVDINSLQQQQQQQQSEQQQQQQQQPQTQSKPTYRPSDPPRSIIMFDGVCNVCDGFVQFVYPRDTKKRFSYQALQTAKGIEILNYYGIPADLSTIVLIEEETGKHYTKSTAVLRILYYLQNPYPLMYSFYYMPTFLRDFCYGQFAKYRYLVMGKKDTCMIHPGLKDRFVDWRSPILEELEPDETKEIALNNGVALTPPMGWNTWNHFGCETSQINATLIIETAMAMVTSGMAAVGYEYVNLDDCWLAKERDAQGRLQADPIRFPDGIAPLAAYVHSLGLKMGIYGDVGNQTCAGFPGSENYLALDAKTYASWGIDYVKMDGCNFPVDEMKEIYTDLSQYLNATGRPMVYSCSWPAYAQGEYVNFTYVGEICNLWREFDDINDNFDTWTAILDQMMSTGRAPFAGPGNWNDPDMLEIGNGGQTTTEYTSFFSLWSIIAAPLIAGNDLRFMSQDTIDILTNSEVIQVDQDPLGIQGTRIFQQNGNEIWSRQLVGGNTAVVLFNRGSSTSTITLTSQLLNIPSTTKLLTRDLWQHKSAGIFQGSMSFSVPSHGCVMLKLSPQ
ncbi:putative alpha-N-acetylgalactosaminidase [Heterostelium album PN500]|uniref:Alpha-galactosidase n=1 Tax=Heterostelium pallidum (strain ATCC 26659 / Pp 5 / PN500) TaxID=670386 RepID=D3B9C5_HETP5|nr:putative alpha-N-acetylgalactosaminidase [Heterostelium album PN500]EFA81837.1 putative alpha-N-acetylgalactosaminidase [Heterostelium album PN500]|eukprot:XP_020433954.1 putative alpha-N-acetylgalactosaminidase [Heterostelium album PN500]